MTRFNTQVLIILHPSNRSSSVRHRQSNFSRCSANTNIPTADKKTNPLAYFFYSTRLSVHCNKSEQHAGASILRIRLSIYLTQVVLVLVGVLLIVMLLHLSHFITGLRLPSIRLLNVLYPLLVGVPPSSPNPKPILCKLAFALRPCISRIGKVSCFNFSSSPALALITVPLSASNTSLTSSTSGRKKRALLGFCPTVQLKKLQRPS